MQPSNKPYQVRIESDGGITGDWKDVFMYANSLEDIAASVGASPADEASCEKFGLWQLTPFIDDWVGPGPDGPGTVWDEIDMDVHSLGDDVLKITWAVEGMNLRREEYVRRRGIITIMPGN